MGELRFWGPNTWYGSVARSLPKEVDTVPLLEDVPKLGSRHYVLNSEDYLLDPNEQVAVKPPRVMVPRENWGAFCGNLRIVGVFSRVHVYDVYLVKGRPLLNRLLGVPKHETAGGVEVLRLYILRVPTSWHPFPCLQPGSAGGAVRSQVEYPCCAV